MEYSSYCLQPANTSH